MCCEKLGTSDDVKGFAIGSFLRASDISQKKKKNFAGFAGANSRKNWPISWDFRGKKVKIRRKIGRFRGRKSKFAEKSADFAGFSGKKSNFEGFSGASS